MTGKNWLSKTRCYATTCCWVLIVVTRGGLIDPWIDKWGEWCFGPAPSELRHTKDNQWEQQQPVFRDKTLLPGISGKVCDLCLRPTSAMSLSSCRAEVGVVEGELLCCTRSGRLPWLPWFPNPLLSVWPPLLLSSACETYKYQEIFATRLRKKNIKRIYCST